MKMLVVRGAALAALILTAACASDDAMPGPAPGSLVTYGGFQGPESVSVDPMGDRYFVTNAGAFGPANDGYISIVNPDGTVATRRWVAGTDEVPLVTPLGSAIHDGYLYVCDTQTIRVFDIATGVQARVIPVTGATFLNDIAIAADGTMYVTNTGLGADAVVFRVTTSGAVSRFAQGEGIQQPNGIDINPDGEIAVVSLGTPNIRVFSPTTGAEVDSFVLPVSGNDGLIALADSYVVSSVTTGKIYEVTRSDRQITLLAEGVDAAASIGYDGARNRIVVPQLQAQALTFLQR